MPAKQAPIDRVMKVFDSIEDRKEARALFEQVKWCLTRLNVFKDDDAPARRQRKPKAEPEAVEK